MALSARTAIFSAGRTQVECEHGTRSAVEYLQALDPAHAPGAEAIKQGQIAQARAGANLHKHDLPSVFVIDRPSPYHPCRCATRTAPAAISAMPSQFGPESFSPRKATPNSATSTTLILSIGATFDAAPSLSARK